MGMQLNIKSDEAYRLAARVSELTGESLTTAVTESLRRRVDAEERRQSEERGGQTQEAWLAEATQLADAACFEFARGDVSPLTSDHSYLYDDDGLPF